MRRKVENIRVTHTQHGPKQRCVPFQSLLAWMFVNRSTRGLCAEPRVTSLGRATLCACEETSCISCPEHPSIFFLSPGCISLLATLPPDDKQRYCCTEPEPARPEPHQSLRSPQVLSVHHDEDGKMFTDSRASSGGEAV